MRESQIMSWKCRVIAGLASALAVASAAAQVRLPQVTVPPAPTVTNTVGETVGAANRMLGSVELREVRKLQIRDLLRRHRDVLERGPDGEPVVRREVLSFEPSQESIEKAQAAGFEIAREQQLNELGTRIVVLLAPNRMSARRALRRLQEMDPEGTYDYNHVYTGSGALGTSAADRVNAASTAPSYRTSAVRIGLIDGGVLQTHPAFSTTKFHSYGCDGSVLPSPHGTAVASLIAVQIAADPLDLYSADVYCNDPTGGSVTGITAAFAWMTRERVPVVNVSLVGPPNRMLERVIEKMLERGHVIVAAVGNDGPNAKPLYPAAYPGVIGVTGVDKRERALPEALRGPQVDFAAAGTDISAANLNNEYASVRGTSFAAPIVAALLATECHEVLPSVPAQIVDKFAKVARDLGKPGLDPTYGFGLLGSSITAQAHRRE